MNPDNFDTWLQQALHEEDDYLPDNGFTERVMAALPPAPAVSERREKLLTWGAGAAAAALAALPLPWGELLAALQATDTQTWMLVAAAPGLLISLGAMAWGVVSFRQQA